MSEVKPNDPCPFCEEKFKRKSPVMAENSPGLTYQFTCMHCFRHYDQDGNLVLVDTSDKLADSSECPRCGFHSGMILTGRRFGKLKIYSCHQCDGLFKENKQELSDEEWAHVWSLSKE